MLDFENRKRANFQFNWFIGFQNRKTLTNWRPNPQKGMNKKLIGLLDKIAKILPFGNIALYIPGKELEAFPAVIYCTFFVLSRLASLALRSTVWTHISLCFEL